MIKHGNGLKLLFMTEMWERFSFYSLRALLPLYLTAKVMEGGLAWEKSDAILLMNNYLAMAYILPVIGGYFADRFLGQRRSVMIGAVLMAIGHFCMAFNSLFFLALALVSIGNGFFKPCLTSILGELYDDSSESQRDSAYLIFYTGINVGAFIGGLVSGWVMENYGYDLGFSIAGFGMLIALFIIWWGQDRYLGEVGKKPQVKTVDHQPVPLTSKEKSQLLVVGYLFLMTIFFFIAWEQTGMLSLYIRDHVDRHFFGWTIPTLWLASLNPFFIIFFAPLLSIFWAYLGKKNLDPFVGVKMGIGFLLLALAFGVIAVKSSYLDSHPHWIWIVIMQFLITIGELCFIPISWAAVTTLSPRPYVTRMMGLMLAGIGLGTFLGGEFVSLTLDTLGETTIFFILTAGLLFFGLISFAMNPILKKMSHK
ncbi:MAG: peptide MFS transporter [Waddliaceae bacterium]